MYCFRVHNNEALDSDGAYYADHRSVLLDPGTLGDASFTTYNLCELSYEQASQRRPRNMTQRREEAGIEVKLVDDLIGDPG